MPDSRPAPLAERLAGLPDTVSATQIAAALGVPLSTVRNWTAQPTWPQAAEQTGRERRYPRAAAADWLSEHEAEPATSADLDGDPDELVTLPQIAARTNRKYNSVSAYPSLYGPGSKDPFPPGDALGRRRWGDVTAWFSRRRKRGGVRAAAPSPTPGETTAEKTAGKPAEVTDVIDVIGIAKAAGKEPDAIRSLMRRRPDLAAMSTGKVGRNLVWPRTQLLAELRKIGYLPEETPRKPTAAERRWLQGGPKSVSELAGHYGVTPGAVTHRIERAEKSGDPQRRPPAAVDPDARVPQYDPAEFDRFWRHDARR